MDGNFDRHDALMMLMLIREDKLRLIGDGDFESRYKDNHSDYLGNDDFFERSFKKHDNKRTLYEIPNNSK